MSRKGFTLVELLIGMTLFLIILMAGIGFFGHARDLFFKLKDAEEDAQAAYSALDRIRMDLVRAGQGLVEPLRLGLLSAVEAGPERLTIASSEGSLSLADDLRAGDARAVLKTIDGIKKGGRVCFLEGARGEVRGVTAIESATLVLDLPVEADYAKERGLVLPVERVSFYLGTADRIVRRQVNASPAQPLIEDIGVFRYAYDPPSNLASVIIELAPHKERAYEIIVFPKNAGLVPRQ
jgi:prepilin-type N-terminal cleavage/methylation domain-containing protein